MNRIVFRCSCIVVVGLSALAAAEEVDTGSLLKSLKEVGPKGGGHRDAIAAWKQLSRADAAQIPAILAGMKGSGRLGENWIRAAVETISQRQVRDGGRLPLPELEEFLSDTGQAPRARRLAYELIASVDDSAEQRLIPSLMNDPSIELRRDAVALALEDARQVEDSGTSQETVEVYSRVFSAARELSQIQAAAAKLKDLGQTVDVPGHMGFLMRWKIIGPFDNVDRRGFDAIYPPEQELSFDATYKGKVGDVRWIEHTTDDEFGIVDLNVILNRPKENGQYELTDEHKEAVAYAYTEFISNADRDVEFRLGSINANKIWLNGRLLTSNHVYHSGMEVDQYVSRAQVKKGLNTILLKIAQNDQTESWAQRWQFQLRICDEIGTAVLSRDRPRTAALDRTLR